MKKILYITTLPDWGGAQNYIFRLANFLKDDFDIVVAFGAMENKSKFNLSSLCQREGIKTHQFKYLKRAINPLKDILAIFEIKNFLEREKPDILHLNSSKAGVIGSLAASMLRIKPRVLYTVHGWVFLEPMNILKRKFYIFLEKLASRWRDILLVLGEREKEAALNLKIAAQKKILVMPHSNLARVPFLEKDEAKETLGLPKTKKIIGAIANFYPAKGLSYLINAAKEIRGDYFFSIIGDGFLKEELEMQIKNSGLSDCFILHGEKPFAARYLNAFDIFVLPSVKEGMPFAILEAISAGLPIVATDVGSIREMLAHYPNKIIVPPGDTQKLKEALLSIEIKKTKYTENSYNVLEEMKKIYKKEVP